MLIGVGTDYRHSWGVWRLIWFDKYYNTTSVLTSSPQGALQHIIVQKLIKTKRTFYRIYIIT